VHTRGEAESVLDTVHAWQDVFTSALGRRMVFAADEYYLMAGRPFPAAEDYEGFCQHENGVGMARTLEQELHGLVSAPTAVADGFFAWVEGRTDAGGTSSVAPSAGTPLNGAVRGGAPADGYRAERMVDELAAAVGVTLSPRRDAPVGILTGEYGATVLAELLPPVLERIGRRLAPDDVRIITVHNEFFGGNTAVAGLMVGSDLQRVLAAEPSGHRYLLPDVCLSKGTFLDGTTPADLPRPVEVVPTDGIALRDALTINKRADEIRPLTGARG
jgi:NifB/MoaA-like Fe-S oxidoreductase